MDKRGAYFFVIDAIIASLVIFASLYFIFTTSQTEPDSTSNLRTLEDYMYYLSTTTIADYPPSNFMEDLIVSGSITNTENTLLDQMVEFYYFNQSSEVLAGFAKNVTRAVVPPDRSIEIMLNSTTIFNRTTRNIEQSTVKISMKRLCFKRINVSFIYGPIVFEAKIWI